MSAFRQLWKKLAKSKRYREEFVGAQVKSGIPFQIRRLMKHKGLTQQELASRAGINQGVVSRAADPENGNLTLNTIIRIAAGFDVAFIGRFVPFSELGRWFLNLSEESEIRTFVEENAGETCAEEATLYNMLSLAPTLETGHQATALSPAMPSGNRNLGDAAQRMGLANGNNSTEVMRMGPASRQAVDLKEQIPA